MTHSARQRGISLLIAIIVTGALLLVATAIANVALKGSQFSSENRESQYAFYAADTGIECALYWDVKNPSGTSAFSTSTASVIECGRDANNGGNFWTVGGNPTGVSQFTMTFQPDPYCAVVRVQKNDDNSTLVQVYGYNTCTSSTHTVQRALQVTY